MSKYMNIVDVESTCWDDPIEDRKNTSEIIEIGIVQIDMGTFEINKCESIIIKPSESTVSEFCTTLTGWTQEKVDVNGIGFEDALELLINNYDSKNLPWGSYGEYDKNMFIRQCNRRGLSYPFSDEHTNIKELLRKKNYKIKGLQSALREFGLTFVGRHHNGLDDAINISSVYAKHVRKYGG